MPNVLQQASGTLKNSFISFSVADSSDIVFISYLFNENCCFRFNLHSDNDSNDGHEQVLNLFVRRVAFFTALN